MKGRDIILHICYGNHPQSAKHKDVAEDLLSILRSDGSVAKTDLMEAAGLDPDDENDDRQFYRIMKPLRGDNNANLTFVTSDTRNGTTFYALSRQAFDATLNQSFAKNIRDFLDGAEIERIKEEYERLKERGEV